jgi:hypothetical protein
LNPNWFGMPNFRAANMDITLALLFYVLLLPVSRYVSLLAAFFGLVSTATFAVAELFYFAASVPALDPDVCRNTTPNSCCCLCLWP